MGKKKKIYDDYNSNENCAPGPVNILGVKTPLLPPKVPSGCIDTVSDDDGNNSRRAYDDFVMPDKIAVEQPSPVFDEYEPQNDARAENHSPDKCESCALRYDCELMAEYRLLVKNNPGADLPFYINEDRRSCAVGSGFKVIHSDERYVADGIGDSFKIDIEYNYITQNYKIVTEDGTDKWRPEVPVFISAQTGRGKNHFIEEVLLPYVRKLNIKKGADQKILIVSNRIALKEQIAKRIKPGTTAQELEDETIHGYKGYDCATVKMYQGLLNFTDRLKHNEGELDKYSFVIFDECHFFTSDAMFNPDTGKILVAITETFKNAIRVFMTATPYEVMPHIIEYERNARQLRGALFYHFSRNYDYLDVKDFSLPHELKDIIVESVGRGEKWLIFIDSKTGCQDVKEMLLEGSDNEADDAGEAKEVENTKKKKTDNPMKGKVSTMDAGDKYNDLHQYMVENERLGGKASVLVSTSVIDNGVNLRDINNIVISDMSKTKCLQMVGRARAGSGVDRITLFVKRHSVKFAEGRINSLKEQEDAYHLFDLAFNGDANKFLDKFYKHPAERDRKNARHWFEWVNPCSKLPYLREIDKVYRNEIAVSMVEKLIPYYKSIFEEMKITDAELNAFDVLAGAPALTGQKYLEYQLSWFGKGFNSENNVTVAAIAASTERANAKDALIEFLEILSASEDQILVEKDKYGKYYQFRKDMTEMFYNAFQIPLPKGEPHGLSNINKFLKTHGLCYMIEQKRDTSGARNTNWSVVRHDWDSDTPE